MDSGQQGLDRTEDRATAARAGDGAGQVLLEVPGRIPATLAGARHPIVAILLLMSFFTVMSGKPVDGLLLFTVACALSWNAGVQARRAAALRRLEARGEAPPGDAGPAATGNGEAVQESIWQLAAGRPSSRLIGVTAACAIGFALLIGSFTRYSWPATAGIVGLGAAVVVIGWGGPIREREVPGKFSLPGVLTWACLLVSCGLWELSALLMQPNFATASYEHPTISTLTDPLLMTPLGRTVALLSWIGLGIFLVLR